MERSDLQSLLDELRSSFDYERFRDSKKPGTRQVLGRDRLFFWFYYQRAPGDKRRRGFTRTIYKYRSVTNRGGMKLNYVQ